MIFFYMIFVIFKCKTQSLAENQTNLADSEKKLDAAAPMEPTFNNSEILRLQICCDISTYLKSLWKLLY